MLYCQFFFPDPLGKMNTSLYKLGQVGTSGFAHHVTMSESSLKKVLHHYSDHVTRLSIMGLQCGMILEDDILVDKLKVSLYSMEKVGIVGFVS